MPADSDSVAAAYQQLLTSRLKGTLLEFEPSIIFRVRIAIQPGIAMLISAANNKGERKDNIPAFVWFVVDHRTALLMAVALVGILLWLAVSFRSRRRLSKNP